MGDLRDLTAPHPSVPADESSPRQLLELSKGRARYFHSSEPTGNSTSGVQTAWKTIMNAKGLSLALALVMVSGGLSNAAAGPVKNRNKGNTPRVYVGAIPRDGGGIIITPDRTGRVSIKRVPPYSPLSPASRYSAVQIKHDPNFPCCPPHGDIGDGLSTGAASPRAR